MRDALVIEPTFNDTTGRLRTFTDNIQSGKLQLLMKSLNENPFPTVRCPMGCYLYIDDELNDKIAYRPACHYLATIIDDFSAFNANPSYFLNARRDWTCPIKDLVWYVQPTLVVDSSGGLCVITCSNKKHADGRTAFIHVPQHPLLGSQSLQTPDILAPAVVSASVVKEGTSNQFNTSFPVFKQQGNSGGLSTVRLAFKTMPKQTSVQDTMCNGLTLTERSDILQYASQASCFQSNTISETLQLYTTQKPPDVDITQSALQATFVEEFDAHFLSSAFNSQSAQSDRVTQEQNLKHNPYDCLLLVHPNTASGHPPFHISRGRTTRGNPTPPMSCLLYATLQAFAHVRILHSHLLHRVWSNDCPALCKDLLNIIRLCSNNTSLTLNPVKAPVLQATSQALQQLDPGGPSEDSLAHILCQLCPKIIHVLADNFDFPNAGQHQLPPILLVTHRGDPLNLQMPELSHDGQWLLLFAMCIDISPASENVLVSFRWGGSFAWQTTGTEQHHHSTSQMRFFVYSTQSSLHLARQDAVMRTGGQSFVRCLLHGDCLLREQVGTQILCSATFCSTQIRWRCAHGLPDQQCDTGLCLKHFRLLREQLHDEPQFVASYGPHLHIPHTASEDHTNDVLSEDEDDTLILLPQTPNTDHDDYQIEPSDQFGLGLEYLQDACPSTTSPASVPYYLSDTWFSTLGHYLLNNHLQVLKRPGRTQKPPVRAQKMLQTICARTPDWTVPLLYPEAQLFPRIFWNMHNLAITGALPSVMFTNIGQNSQKLHIASLKQHMFVRLMDGSLLTSRNTGYLQFIFDVNLNSVLNGNSAAIACQKGLEHLTHEHNTLPMGAKENIMPFDQIDARREVKRLSAVLRAEGPWDYFVTLTCNDSGTMGVWPIRAAILQIYAPAEHDAMLQNYAVIMCRSWERTGRYFWNYIQYSSERPLGHVKCAWMRYEFQSAGALGNRPHIHGGVTLHPEPEQVSLERIRCSIKDFFTASARTDLPHLIQDGFISDLEQFIPMFSLASQLQSHSCVRAGSRCMKRRASDDSLICRVPKHPPGLSYYFQEKEGLYDEQTLERLQFLDLGTLDPYTNKWTPLRAFRGGFWHYPAQPGEHFVPTVPLLFVALRSSSNVQLCDRKFQVAYLAKYAAGIDEKRQVSLTVDSSTPNSVHANVQPLKNTKITGQAIKNPDKGQSALAREIALTEMIWFSLGLPYVTCPVDTTHVSTLPPEYRAAVIKRPNTRGLVEGGGGQLVTVEQRRNFPEWRNFTDSQQLAMLDYSRGSYYLDVTTAFSVRPPELLLFDSVELYAKCFTFTSIGRQRHELHIDLGSCQWVDGALRRVKLRHSHVLDACQHIFAKAQSPDGDHAQQALELCDAIFNSIHREHLAQHGTFSALYLRFVDITKTRRNVVIYTQVSPNQFSKFLVHLMLSLGKFVTEIDLYSAPSMLDAFRRASLLTEDQPTVHDVQRIARSYVLDQLQWLGISTRQFARLLQCLLEGLDRFLLQEEIAYDALPLFLERNMIQQANDEVQLLEHSRRKTAVDALYHELNNLIPDFPDVNALINGDIVPFQPRITPLQHQLQASIAEQEAALQLCISAVDHIFRPDASSCYWPLLVGPPGSGKTHILLLAQLYALSRGLNAQIIALTSERARRLGGEHIHLLFRLPVLDYRNHTITSMAETTIIALARSPIRLAALQRIDVLLVEEIGLISAETFAVIDTVLRHIRDSPVPMGGVLVIACGDPRQLSPVTGSLIWTSHHLITTFKVISLKHYVRALQDGRLQIVLELLRRSTLTEEEINQFKNIIQQHCIPQNCVTTWQQVPPHILRIVATRQASKEILQEFLHSKLADPTLQCFTFQACDEIEVPGGQVLPASHATSLQLNDKCLEPASLVVFRAAVMRLTYNNTNVTPLCPRFSQGQLCVVHDITAHPTDPSSSTISVRLVPPGHRDFDVNNLPDTWPLMVVKMRITPPLIVSNRRTKAWRKQFPLCHFVCSTVHKAIGETLPQIATQLSLTHKQYRLWEREQLLVLLSRVHSLDDITFVSQDPDDTLSAIMQLLLQPSRWAAHVDVVLNALDCHNIGPRVVRHQLSPLPSGDHTFPDVNVGFVYMLVSSRNCTYAYVGETCNIRRRLQEHNSGHGARFTQDPYLRPWALMALVTGFPGPVDSPENIHARKAFEREWHYKNGQLPVSNVLTILANGHVVYAEARLHNPDLVMQEFLHVGVVLQP